MFVPDIAPGQEELERGVVVRVPAVCAPEHVFSVVESELTAGGTEIGHVLRHARDSVEQVAAHGAQGDVGEHDP
jgi:hypothetical protein